jgi:hypothetical protein
MKTIHYLILFTILAFLLTGCSAIDSGRPMPTKRLEGVLPDSFGDYKLYNTVRNAGGPPVSEVTGHYKTGRATEEGEIRIVVQDWGASETSTRMPIDERADSFEYGEFKCYRAVPAGQSCYQVRIPVRGRILLKIEYDDVPAQDETIALDAIKWGYLEKIVPKKGL